jgi:hypothetical protein
MPHGRAVPDRRNATRVPARKIIDHISIVPSPGGQVSGMADTSGKTGSVGGLGVASRRSPLRATTRLPGAGLATSAGGGQGCCPRRAAWSGDARTTGCHTAPSVQELSVPTPPSTPLIQRKIRPGREGTGERTSSPRATGRAKYVPDAAVTDGVQRGATGTPIVTPQRTTRPVITGQGFSCWCGGSRIRTLEGISRQIYSPLHATRA